MVTEVFANDAQAIVTNGGTTAPASGTVETWTVNILIPFITAVTGIYQFHVADTATVQYTEKILVTSGTGSAGTQTWTVTRGAENTTPVAHLPNFIVQQVVTAGVLSGFQSIAPSGDVTGITDSLNLQNALNAASTIATNPGGNVVLGPGQFFINTVVSVPAQSTTGTGGGFGCSLLGNGSSTVVNVVGNGGIYCHRTNGYGAQFGLPAQHTTSRIRDFVIDGSAATSGAIGLDIGDGWGFDVDVTLSNFTHNQAYTATNGTPCTFTVASSVPTNTPVMLSGTPPTGFTAGQVYYVVNPTSTTIQLATVPGTTASNSTSTGNGTLTDNVSFWEVSRVFWTEKGRFRISSLNNSIAALIDTFPLQALVSKEYNLFDISMFCNSNQQGVVFASGVNGGGDRLYIQGNMAVTSSGSGAPTNNVAALTFAGTDGSGNYSRLYQGHLEMKVEGNTGNGTGSVMPYGIAFGNAFNAIKQCEGRITHSLGTSNLNVAGIPNADAQGEFSFTGMITDAFLAGLFTGPPGSTLCCQTKGFSRAYTATSASPCVFTDSSGWGTAPTNGTAIQLSSGAPTGFSNNTTYYVVNSAGATFQLALIQGGTAVTSASTGAGNFAQQAPASTIIANNYGPAQIFTVSGGTISQINVNGTSTGLTSGGPFYLNAGGFFKLNYTAAPSTLNYCPASQSQY